jgi:hypothetical protein
MCLGARNWNGHYVGFEICGIRKEFDMRLPKFIRYFMYRSRLMRMLISFDIFEKERILNSYFSANFAKFSDKISNICLGEYIRFQVSVDDIKNSEELQEFDAIAKSLCKRLGYELVCSWAGGNCNKPYFYYSVIPTGLTYRVKEHLKYYTYDLYCKDMEEYYEILWKRRKSPLTA